jgi:hypothetical protein
MPKPSTVPTWATGAGRRLEPSSGEKADGFVAGARAPARKSNWIVGGLTDWAAYLDEWIDGDDELVYPVDQTRSRYLPLTSGVVEAGTTASISGIAWSFDAGGGILRWPLDLPHRALITRVSARVTTADASGTLQVGLRKILVTGGGGTITPTETFGTAAPASAGAHEIEYEPTAPGEEVFNSSGWYELVIDSDVNGDVVHWVRVEWTEPAGVCGPRNF